MAFLNFNVTPDPRFASIAFGSKVAVNSCLASTASILSTIALDKDLRRNGVSLHSSLKGLLVGAVSVTACGAFIQPWAAFVVGVVGGQLCVAARYVLFKLKLDDTVGTIPVHLIGGVWSALSVGVFATRDATAQVYGISRCAATPFSAVPDEHTYHCSPFSKLNQIFSGYLDP